MVFGTLFWVAVCDFAGKLLLVLELGAQQHDVYSGMQRPLHWVPCRELWESSVRAVPVFVPGAGDSGDKFELEYVEQFEQFEGFQQFDHDD